MAKIRKPIPKTQKQIGIDRHTPTDPRYGNPNIPLPSNENDTGIPFNRSEKLSWKGDDTKPFSDLTPGRITGFLRTTSKLQILNYK